MSPTKPLKPGIDMRRTISEGREYLLICIEKPLTDYEILMVGEFLESLERDSNWRYVGSENANTA